MGLNSDQRAFIQERLNQSKQSFMSSKRTEGESKRTEGENNKSMQSDVCSILKTKKDFSPKSNMIFKE